MRRTAAVRPSLLPALALSAALASGGAWALSEFGIEGMGVVATRADEVRGAVSPDGQRIVWASPNRDGGAGGWDLWQASLRDGRWQDPRALSLNTRDAERDPAFSADGRWLYFASDRRGGRGGLDLYRAPVERTGIGAPRALAGAVNTRADERSPTPSRDGRALLFAGNGGATAGGFDLFVAALDGDTAAAPRPLAGVNTRADEFDGAWLDGGGLVFARADAADAGPSRLHVARCDGRRYAGVEPLTLSFNTADGRTLGAMLDWNKPAELLVTGSARSPRAGGLDLYRMKAPAPGGQPGCAG